MTDRFRYLPCGLHEALEIPRWWAGLGGGPLVRGGQIPWLVDLAHPAGWDHAVRALAAMRGVEVPESSSIAFLTGDFDSEVIDGWTNGLLVGVRRDRAQDRREALCRCICGALGLDVDNIFPKEKP